MIEFKNVSVSFKFRGQTVNAVDDVSFKIPEGSVFGIVGGSGAGKSTLLRTINGLQSVTGGSVIADGRNVAKLKGKELREFRKNIGMIFQHFNLAESRTVYGNIAFILESAGWKKNDIDRRVTELLEFVNLSDKRDAYPAKLSGGQKQRVAIARALANNTKILLCDEPTSALDAETTASVLELLKKVNSELNVTIVIITHELDVVKDICDRVAVMNHGKLEELGDVYQVFTKPDTAFTEQLIAHTYDFSIPENILSGLEGEVIKLTYLGKGATDSVLSDTAKEYDVRYNILHGKIEYIGEKPLGILYVNIIGTPESREKTIKVLEEKVEKLEVIANA
ncbi:MAG: ATP-binding cassette domain-containing protein [Oscillospiraceae bacterium]|nr:ATP-binding cassette domain-containing protein [Oscillospiraceae bacterium]